MYANMPICLVTNSQSPGQPVPSMAARSDARISMILPDMNLSSSTHSAYISGVPNTAATYRGRSRRRCQLVGGRRRSERPPAQT